MLKRLLPRSDFAKNVVGLTLGSSVAQGITFLLTLFLARIYSPAHFGSFSLYVSILSLVLAFSTGKYDVAIVVAKNSDTLRLVRLCFFIAFGVSLVVILGVTCIYLFSLPLYRDNVIYNWYYFIALSVILQSGMQIFWMWNVRKKSFRILSYVRIAEALAAGGAAILLRDLQALGLLLANMAGNFLTFCWLGYDYLRKSDSTQEIKGKDLVQTASEYSEFPRINILQGFIEMFQMTAIILVGSRFFRPEVVGYYAFCIRILQAPIGLIVKPIAHVFFAEASEVQRKGGDLSGLVLRTIRKTALYTSPLPIVIGLAGPFLFSTVFGEKWHEAGVYAQILVVWIYLDLIRAPIAQIATVVGKQKIVLAATVAGNIILTFILLASAYLIDNPRIVFSVIAASQSLFTIFIILLQRKLSRSVAAARPAMINNLEA